MSRLILKISGEALKEDNKIVSENKLNSLLETIKILKNEKHNIAIVVGGGNIFRGREHEEFSLENSSTVGILGTIINALYIKEYLSRNNINVTLSTPVDIGESIKNVSDSELLEDYNNGNVIVFGGGIGKSGYSTDSGVILADDKLKSELIIKLTNVDGVYSDDPKINKNAIKYDTLNYDYVIKNNLKIMDKYALEKCKERNRKILVLSFSDSKKISKYFEGEKIGTEIGE